MFYILVLMKIVHVLEWPFCYTQNMSYILFVCCGISVYVPHCGYSAEHLEQTYDQLRYITSKARRSNKKIIGGRDFNTQFGIGIRGLLLDQFAEEFGLNVTNASGLETNVDWTFRSSVGVCRRLDFIFASQN